MAPAFVLTFDDSADAAAWAAAINFIIMLSVAWVTQRRRTRCEACGDRFRIDPLALAVVFWSAGELVAAALWARTRPWADEAAETREVGKMIAALLLPMLAGGAVAIAPWYVRDWLRWREAKHIRRSTARGAGDRRAGAMGRSESEKAAPEPSSLASPSADVHDIEAPQSDPSRS